MSNKVVVQSSRGQRYEIRVAGGVNLSRLAGEIVIISVPDKKICHPLIPDNNAIEVVVAKSVQPPVTSTSVLSTPQTSLSRIKPPLVLISKPDKSKQSPPQQLRNKPSSSIAQANVNTVNELIAQTESASALMRAQAVAHLAQYQEFESTGKITSHLLDVDQTVRQKAALACKTLGLGTVGNLVVKLAAATPEQCRKGQVRDALRKLIGITLNAHGNHDRQYHGVYLVGLLRLSSLLPELLPLCFSPTDVALRRAAARTLCQLSLNEAIPILLLLAADNDPMVRCYAAAALADAQVYTMSQTLLNDADIGVRNQAAVSFIGIDVSTPWAEQYRVSTAHSPYISPVYLQDVPKKVSTGDLSKWIKPFLQSGDTEKQKAGVSALLWSGGHESYKILKEFACSHCDAALLALKEHFGVEAKIVTPRKVGPLGKLNPIVSLPAKVPVDAYRNAPQRNRHPVFRYPFPEATVLIVGGDGREQIYQKTFALTAVELLWRSGFAPKNLLASDFKNIDAVVLVANEVSAATYERVVELTREAGDIPCAYSQTASIVSIGRTIRTLLTR